MSKRKKETEGSMALVPFGGGELVTSPGVGMSMEDIVNIPSAVPGLQELRKQALRQAGLLGKRQKYASKEDRKEAQKERAKDRREERKRYLESKGLKTSRIPKLSKEQKRARSKEIRKIRNLWLKNHPEDAKRLGFDIERLRVF